MYVFYKGAVINPIQLRKNLPINNIKQYIIQQVNSGLTPGAKLSETVKAHIVDIVTNKRQINTIIFISHIGIYAADIYEFHGRQYLGTWDIINKTIDINWFWDANFNRNDVEDDEDLSISNQTFQDYRQHTGKGQDFIIASPIRLVRYPSIITI